MTEYIYSCINIIICVFAFKLLLNEVVIVHFFIAHTTQDN